MENPFKIEENIPLKSVPTASKEFTFLSQAMAAMPVSRQNPLFMPASVYDEKGARNAVNAVKRELRKSIASMSDCEFKTKKVLDAEENYIGMRVYRIN